MRYLSSIPLVLLATGGIAGEPGDATPERPGPVIRISVEVIQLDVVVTDKQGRHVIDLEPGDFEIREDGRVQSVSHATYVRAGEPWTDPTAPPVGATSDREMAPTAPVPPRTLVLVYDDLGMSLDSAVRARKAFLTVVDGLLPADRAAIVSTGDWNGALRLSSDRQELHAAASRLRFRPDSRDGAPPSFFTDAGSYRLDDAFDRNQRLTVDSLAVTMQVIEELQAVQGRKAVILVSEGFPDITMLDNHYVGIASWPVDPTLGRGADVPGTLRRVGDFAARASVVVHALDPRGLVASGPGAAEATSPPLVDPHHLRRQSYMRQTSQASLQYLPRETGGMAILDNNDVALGARRILDDMSGYYLVGYQPGEATFDGDRLDYHGIEVSVKRKGVKVRTRRGFYGVSDEQL
jgi:VWFA-related protein